VVVIFINVPLFTNFQNFYLLRSSMQIP